MPPDIELELLTGDFKEQLESGQVSDATLSNTELPPLQSPRGQSAGISRCSLRAVTITDPAAQRLRMQDTLIDSSDLANIDLSDSALERVEITSTRLTGGRFIEAHLKDVLFRECKLDLIQLRMGRLQQCMFEQCNLADADFYGADLSGTIFRGCDLSRADLSSTADWGGHPRLPPGWPARDAGRDGGLDHQSGSGCPVDHPVRRSGCVVISGRNRELEGIASRTSVP